MSQGASGGGASAAGKRKRSLSIGGVPPPATAAVDMESAEKSEGAWETAEDAAAREREAEEAREAAVSAARPALVFCRVVDALQHALKSGAGAAIGSTSSSTASQQGTLDVFLSGGDDFLQAASRAAYEAYEAAVSPAGSGGGVDEIISAMGLRGVFAGAVEIVEEGARSGIKAGDDAKNEKKQVAGACRERVMNLLCEGELFAVASSRLS